MTGLRLLVVLLLGAAASVGLLWLTEIPLGVPGEWTWSRIDANNVEIADSLFGITGGLLVGAIYLGFVFVGVRRIEHASPWELRGWLAGLTASGMLFFCVGQSVTQGEFTDVKWAWILYDPGASGYFHDSVDSDLDTPTFLAGYETKMAEGDVFHIGTHPPGLFLANRGLLTACRQSDVCTDALIFTQPDSVSRAFDSLEEQVRHVPRRLTRAERAALWASVLLTHFFAAATVIPLFLLVRAECGREAGWMAAAFWPLIPAVLIFLPKSDALLPFLGMSFLASWRTAVRKRSALFACLSGLIFWLGVNFSLALLPVGFLAVLLTVWGAVIVRDDSVSLSKRMIVPGVLSLVAAVTLLAATAAVWWAVDLNLFNVWSWNIHNHAGFYERSGFTRTYWKWLLVNPVELVLALGWPVFLLGVIGPWIHRRKLSVTLEDKPNAGWGVPEFGLFFCCLVTWGLLWVSGKNMGEAARLWLFLLPWFPWLMGRFWAGDKKGPLSFACLSQEKFWLIALGIQMAVCILTISRVAGFDFGG
jgi:methylthioxylose transferase